MADYYVNPASTVDLIVFFDGGIILIKRKHEPFKDCWALPGGFLELGKETLEQAAVRELFEETSLITNPEELKLVGVYSDPRRDPRGHVISHVYEVRNYSGKLSANDDAVEVKAFRELPNKLAFDHKKIISDYFKNRQLEVII